MSSSNQALKLNPLSVDLGDLGGARLLRLRGLTVRTCGFSGFQLRNAWAWCVQLAILRYGVRVQEALAG